MATGKRCGTVRDHKPHLWSRTTRKTVTEETAGDTFQCPGKAKLALRSPEDERGAQIAADARSGTNWASQHEYGPACLCGMKPARRCARHGVTQGSRVARGR